MSKNVVIGLLLTLLVVVGFIIVRDERNSPAREDVSGGEPRVKITEEEVVETFQSEGFDENDFNSLLFGVWQSVDDSQNTIAFYANGEMTDSYGGGAINEMGTYQLFRNSTNLLIDGIQNQQSMVLRQTFGTEEYYYEVETLSEDLLELIFVRDGSVVRYERMSY
jgi:hypothetical protein